MLVFRISLRKYILFIGLFLVSSIYSKASAQDWIANMDYRMEIGATASTITNMQAEKSTYNYSGRIGASISVPLLSPIYISSGVFITQKGVKLNLMEDNKLVAKPTYIEMPLEVSYRLHFNDESDIFFNLGGYAAVGVVGKFDFTGYDFSNDTSIEVFKTAGKPIKRFDAGLSASLLYEYMSFALRIGGSYGLINTVNRVPDISYWNPIQGKNAVNIQAYISIGYRFFYY